MKVKVYRISARLQTDKTKDKEQRFKFHVPKQVTR